MGGSGVRLRRDQRGEREKCYVEDGDTRFSDLYSTCVVFRLNFIGNSKQNVYFCFLIRDFII